jgi:hypothetical protein
MGTRQRAGLIIRRCGVGNKRCRNGRYAGISTILRASLARENNRSVRSRTANPVALRDDRWPWPSRDIRYAWAPADQCTSIAVPISGRFVIILLSRQSAERSGNLSHRCRRFYRLPADATCLPRCPRHSIFSTYSVQSTIWRPPNCRRARARVAGRMTLLTVQPVALDGVLHIVLRSPLGSPLNTRRGCAMRPAA